MSEETLRQVKICTDRFHYENSLSRKTFQNLPHYLKKSTPSPDDTEDRTARWRLWFEKYLLKQSNGSQNKMSDLDKRIYGTLYCAYKRCLHFFDNKNLGERRVSSVLEILDRMEEELEKDVKYLDKLNFDKVVVKRLAFIFLEIKKNAKMWLIREHNSPFEA